MSRWKLLVEFSEYEHAFCYSAYEEIWSTIAVHHFQINLQWILPEGSIQNLQGPGAGHFHMQSLKSPQTEGDELGMSRNTTEKVLQKLLKFKMYMDQLLQSLLECNWSD